MPPGDYDALSIMRLTCLMGPTPMISPVTHTDLLAFLIISQTSLSLTRALVLATSFTGKLFFPGSYSVYFFMFFRFFLKFNLIISEIQYI